MNTIEKLDKLEIIFDGKEVRNLNLVEWEELTHEIFNLFQKQFPKSRLCVKNFTVKNEY